MSQFDHPRAADAPRDNDVRCRMSDEPEHCGYCGELATVFFSYNPEAKPDICPDCFALTEGTDAR